MSDDNDAAALLWDVAPPAQEFAGNAIIAHLENEVIPWVRPHHEASRQLRQTAAPRALASAEGFLRRGARAGAPGAGRPGGSGPETESEARSQCEAILEWARRHARLIDPSLENRLDGIGGVEHDVFHEAGSGRWIKLTMPGKGGKELRARQEGPGISPTLATEDALPSAYLRRLQLANAKLGDAFYLHGVIATPHGPRLVVSQPHVGGGPATRDEIAWHFKSAGFQQLNAKTFYHSGENLLVSDAHIANVLKTASGDTVPFDVGVQQPTGALLLAVKPAAPLSFDDEDALGETQQTLLFRADR